MTASLHPVVGTIRMEPMLAPAHAAGVCEDQTLELLFASFVHREALSDLEQLPRAKQTMVTTARLCRATIAGHNASAIRANLAQLIEDLQSEYEQLG
jgi:hypothetical protein